MLKIFKVREIVTGIKRAYVVGGFFLGMVPATILPVTERICSAYSFLTKRKECGGI